MRVIETFDRRTRVHSDVDDVEVVADDYIIRLYRDGEYATTIPLHGPEITIKDAADTEDNQ